MFDFKDAPHHEWYVGRDVMEKLLKEIEPSYIKPNVNGLNYFSGMKVFQDPDLPDDCFELRNPDGTVLQR